jgi:hypothetical protein
MLVSALEKWLLQDIEKMHRTKVHLSKHDAEKWDGAYKNIRLNRSTDKMGSKKLASAWPKPRPKAKYPSKWPATASGQRNPRPADTARADDYGHKTPKRTTKKPAKAGGSYRWMGKPKHSYT